MKSTVFKFIDGGRKNPIVLIPGWATDYRIFACSFGCHCEVPKALASLRSQQAAQSLRLRLLRPASPLARSPRNDRGYLIPIQFSPFDFEKRLLEKLRETGIAKISLFGHSLGGFVAQEFALKHPDLVDELILVSIRKRYRKEELQEAKTHLKRNKKAYLYKFYRRAFFNKDGIGRFKSLLKTYLEEFNLDFLLETLDYLADSEIKPHLLKDIKKVKIIHGENDRIAPIEEAIETKNSLPQATFVAVKNAGHFPFF